MSEPTLPAAHRLYRFSIWLPLVVPAVVIVTMTILVNGLGLPRPSGVLDVTLEGIAGSGLFGGLPYLALALWARRWMRGRSERAIQRLMLVAPVLMVGAFAGFCLVMGLFAARFPMWFRIAWEFSPLILILGYAYVALTFLLRATLVRPGGIAPAHPHAL